jgi:hypothetical protein
MGFFRDDEIADVRAEIAGLLCDTYAVLRTTSVSDGMGGQTVTTSTSSTGACRLDQYQSGAGTEQVIAEQLDTINPTTIILPWTADVTPADRLVVNGTRTFDVAAVNTDGAQALSRIAICKEIT